MPYHPQANGVVEAFNKIMENALKKICNIQRDGWDQKISVVLWAYRTTCKKLTSRNPFHLVYGQEVVMPMEYIVPILRIVVITYMTYIGVVEEILSQLVQLEEDHFVVGDHQNIEKERHKVWNDHHIKNKQFQVGGLVLLYDIKLFKHLGKLKTHWLGLYIVTHITDGGVVKLKKLDGTPIKGMVNGIPLNFDQVSR